MKTPLSSPTLCSLPVLAAGALLASATLLCAQTWYWQGPDGTGNNGDWDASANWSNNTLPDGDQALRFDYNASGPYSSQSATITVGEEVEAKAGGLAVRLGKKVTFILEDEASLTSSGNLNVGSGANSGATGATFQGPETGSATVKVHRIYMTTDTGGRKTVEFTGKGLSVEQTGSYTDLNTGASLILSGGAKLTALNTPTAKEAGNFHLRAVSSNGLNNRLILENGTLSANLIYAYGGAALVQLSRDAVLKSSGTDALALRINNAGTTNGARFEAEGSGLDATVDTRVYNNGVLAIGLSDPETGERMQASSLTLQSNIQLDGGSILEVSLFGSGDAGVDQIHFSTAATTKLDIKTGALLDLRLNGYTPTLGESWTLFTGDTSKIAGSFNLDLIDPAVWDLSSFNETGGWVIVSQIPEPSGAAFLLLGGTGMIALLRRLRHHRA
ncbi:MAG TPA: hypothetical protein VNQ90_16910 [Chthoniobacteraceae bacterium]|nr:hypothetical protein [Chthoniobacteraceae bacterium]